MFDMEKIVEIFKNLIPDFKGDRIMTGAFFMFFIIIFLLSYLFFKYVLHCAFSNPFLNTMWAICTFCLAMALICFLSAYKDYLIIKNKEKKEREHFLFVLKHCSKEARDFFKEFVTQNSNTIIMNKSQHSILNYLRLQDINIGFIGDEYYKITKEQFEMIVDYFNKT